ncbi:P1/s1 nuclease (macronuclear) [Tetrahymena thermophila SB210]|uniref:P1/s1 nuclease n=1 Tax=Tetrahymena thermophila (strain SB210) TaxID=312017 RepID=I7MHU1_TETTS|nr:P1/s1 nuclease [Tetrahymena thermophila SB210]EAR89889.1 P1/s1 nuclease [Tetrahymena thermophila SB210]|eukprot:XP_001010134.1 P1/s1 nuclease [Tetrahymena thermophila SB210]
MLVLGIAKRELMKNDMEIYNITAKYFDTYSISGLDTISTTSYEENAVWGDDIKTYGDVQKAMGMWHFIGNKDSNPYNLTLYKDPMADSENALNAYANIVKTLTNKNFVGKITEFKVSMLKMLVHLVGDIHMPHHTGTYYNKTFVKEKGKDIYSGDKGGNKQKIQFYTSTGKKEKTDIHFYFDSSCFFYTWTSRLVRPLNETFKIYFERELERIMAQYPKESLNINYTQTFDDWAEESWNIALTDIYPFLMQNNVIRYGDAFYNSSFNMIQKRIVVAGYRLAHNLQTIFAAEKGKIDLSTSLSYESEKTTIIINNQIPLDNNTSTQYDSNKVMAVIFGVLFGLTLTSYIIFMIYFKITYSAIKSQNKISSDFFNAKNGNMQKIPSTETNEYKA